MVEDNELNRKIIVQKLIKNNYQVNEAENGHIALEKEKSWKPDLILLDIMMPELDGLQVLKILRETKSQAELPIILVTAMQDSEDIVKGFQLGANDYLPKNYNTEELLARVNTAIQIRYYHKLLKERNNTIERELDMARLIQKKILPIQSPNLPGYVIGSLYIPMDKIGGDFFDYIEGPEYCDFFMADVSGHGVPGALIASILKMSVQYLMESHLTPPEMLHIMDKAVSERGALGMFATGMIVRLFLDTNKILYSNAGHHALLLHRRSNDTFIELTTVGAPLGINYDFKMKPYVSEEFQLELGDRLILYTDGIIEAMDECQNEFGNEEWHNFLIKNKNTKIEELSILLMENLKSFSKQNSFEDDITWIVIDYIGN